MQLIRIVSYNIHKGFSLRHKAFILDAIKVAIQTLNVDVVCLQEVIGEHETYRSRVETWPTVAQVEHLADQAWPNFAYGKNAVYEEGHHGNAILSRFPITSWENIDISFGAGEHRGVLHAALAIPGHAGTFDCYCTHLGLNRRGRQRQLEQLCDRVAATVGDASRDQADRRPFMIAGDFNDWERRACKLLERRLGSQDVGVASSGRVQRTYPSFFPLLSLDRVYVRGVRVQSARVPSGPEWRKLSDHLPLYAELIME